MNRTLKDFLTLKGSNTPTKEQVKLAGLENVPTKKGWLKDYMDTEITEDAWDKLITTLNIYNLKDHGSSTKIYIIANSKNHRKIGVAGNVWHRLQQLQTANSEPLTLLRLYSFPSPYRCETDVEKKLHEIFKASRMMGEWFGEDVNCEDVDTIVLSIGGKIVYNV